MATFDKPYIVQNNNITDRIVGIEPTSSICDYRHLVNLGTDGDVFHLVALPINIFIPSAFRTLIGKVIFCIELPS